MTAVPPQLINLARRPRLTEPLQPRWPLSACWVAVALAAGPLHAQTVAVPGRATAPSEPVGRAAAAPVTVADAAILATTPAAALAATAGTAGIANTTPALQVVQVTARHYDNGLGLSDAASQGVVRAETLASRPLLRPGEALETVPGLVVTQHSGDGKANQYFLRGLNLDHGTDFATSVNGVPVNLPSHAHGQGYSDLNFLIPELVSRIAYRKGPYFAKNGDFSAAGSADIDYQTRLAAPFAQLTLGGDRYRRAVLAGSTALGRPTNPGQAADDDSGLHLLAAAELMGNDGPWTLREGLHRTNGLLTLSSGSRASGWSATLAAYAARWNATDQIPQRLIDAGRYQGLPFGRFDAIDTSDGGNTQRRSLSARWHGTDADGGITQISAFALHSGLQLFSNFSYALDRPDSGGDQFSQQDQRRVYGLAASRTYSHAWGPFPARSELGLQARHDRIHLGLFDTVARATVATTRVDDVRETLLSAYAQTSIELSPKVRSVLGLRADRINVNVASALQPQNSGTAAQTLLSPKLSLVLGPWQETEFFVNAGSGFHSNDARGMTAKIDPKTGDATDAVPGLVKARGAELGLRTEALAAGLQSAIALWRLDFDSELSYVGDAGTTEPKGASQRFGLEWNNHWGPSQHWQFDLDAAWTHARFRQDQTDDIGAGRFVPNAVNRVITGTVSLADLGPWSASLTQRYIGAGALTTNNQLRSTPSRVANLRVGLKLGPRHQLTLDILNLMDRRYSDIEYVYPTRLRSETVAVANDKLLHPGEPRTLRLTWRGAFF